MAEKRLRVVKADEKPPARRRRRMSVTQAATAEDERQLLVAMRDRVAKDVENPNTASRDIASLTRRLLEISREIAAFDARAAEDAEGAGAATPDDTWEAV